MKRMPVRSWLIIALAACPLFAPAWSLAVEPGADQNAGCPRTTAGLYARIRSIGLDPQHVYHVRDATIDRPNLHIDLDDGSLAFTEDICGHITGAFFTGEGEIRLRPPNREERGSLALFTGMAILEEQITEAYLRFNDDTAATLQPFLLPEADSASITKEENEASRNLAEFDALRLLLDFSHFLPSKAKSAESTDRRPSQTVPSTGPSPQNEADGKFPAFLHAHLIGKNLGGFEVVWDAAATESVWAGQPHIKDGTLFFDIWTSFAPNAPPFTDSQIGDTTISAFRIRATVQPPTMLRASTDVNLKIRSGGQRTLLFELSRYLKLDALDENGQPLDFIQNPAIEGSQLQRKGNDIVAVVFPAALTPGQELKLHFSYAGEVLSEAGNGLLYVGERGTWYPSFGMNPAQFDVQFRYPANWTLVATGKKIAYAPDDGKTVSDPIAEKVSHWISDRPIPVAGFNLGKYVRAEARAGSIMVEAYGTTGVEKSFPKSQPEVADNPSFPRLSPSRPQPQVLVTPPPPSPARDVQAVADKAAKAIGNFSQWFGPYPYGSLSLTQMPGKLSQGWPGLVFLSSYAFLSPEEQADLHLDSMNRALDSQVLVHETAHQWWGDLVGWKSYRDQWIMEGLANYSSLLILEQKNPDQFREVLEKYRRDLLSQNKDGERLRDAGPVTLGLRLESSHFTQGYDEISYERGTWLFHMLRSMLRDSTFHDSAFHDSTPGDAQTVRSRKGHAHSLANPDEPFFRILRKVRERYAGKTLSTEQLIQAFEEDLPRPLWYEKRPKLDWFLESWIQGTAIPSLEAREIHFVDKPGAVTITGIIVQKDAPDDLVTAIPVYGSTTDKALIFLGEVLADGHETAFRLTAPNTVHKIVLDPFQTILSAPK